MHLVLCIAVNLVFLLAIVKEGAGNGVPSAHKRVTAIQKKV